MSIDAKVDQVKLAIENAHNNSSKLSVEAMSVRGFTGSKIRHLLNNLGAISENYLEIGVYKGATFIASNFQNSLNAYCCDNWSSFCEHEDCRSLFHKNTKDFIDNPFKVFDQSCWDLTKKEIDKPIDFYLYDGAHEYEDQFKALSVIYPLLDDTFIYCVDDWSWPAVNTGCRSGIKECDLTIEFEQELVGENSHPEWWNGFYVAVLTKKQK